MLKFVKGAQLSSVVWNL